MEEIEEVMEATAMDLGDLLDAGDHAMVTLVAGDTHLVAHGAVLSARSPVFAAKLCSETLEPSSDPLAIPDVEGPVLRQLVAYLYTLQAPQLPAMAPQLLAAADVYGLSALKAQCEKQAVAQLSVENAAAMAVLAVKHSTGRLRQAAVELIQAHTLEVMATHGWAEAVRTHPEDVVEVSRLLSESPTETSSSHVSEPAPMDPTEEVTETTAVDLGALLDAGDGAVVTLVAGDTRLVAHRAVLAARSPQLAATVGHDRLQSSGGHLAIPDVEGPALRRLLSYLYTLQPPQLPGTAAQLLAAAHKYGLSELKAHCEHLVAAHLSVLETVAASVDTEPENMGEVVRLLSELLTGANPPTTADNGTTPPTELRSDDDSLTTAPSVLPTAACKCHTRKDPTISRTRIPVAPDNRTTATNRSNSNHGQTAVSASSPVAASHSHPPDDAAVSCLRSLSAEEKGKRLIEAAEAGAMEELGTLLAAGADVGARGEEGETALHRAAARGHAEAAARLLAAGAQVGARGGASSTPLHWAAVNGRAAVAELLLAAAADPGATDQNGWTPLHYAAYGGHADVAALLLQAGADRGATSNAADTPFDIARLYNQQHMMDMLRFHQHSSERLD